MAKFSLDSAYVETLAQLMGEYDLREISVRSEEFGRLTLKRGLDLPLVASAGSVSPLAAAAGREDSGKLQPAFESGREVTSPIVGTAYLSSKPDALSFVKAGDTVKEGDTLLIVEAMKIMNQITAPCAGRVRSVHVGNAQPVEYGDLLVILDTL